MARSHSIPGRTRIGVIDFEAVRWITRRRSAGRLIGSLVADDDAGWAAAAQRLSRASTFVEEEAQRPLVGSSGVVVSLFNWLRGAVAASGRLPIPVLSPISLPQLVERIEKWQDSSRSHGMARCYLCQTLAAPANSQRRPAMDGRLALSGPVYP